MFRHFFQEVAGLTGQTLAIAGIAGALHQGGIAIYKGFEKNTFFSQTPPHPKYIPEDAPCPKKG